MPIIEEVRTDEREFHEACTDRYQADSPRIAGTDDTLFVFIRRRVTIPLEI